jgi:hypothetical protein
MQADDHVPYSSRAVLGGALCAACVLHLEAQQTGWLESMVVEQLAELVSTAAWLGAAHSVAAGAADEASARGMQRHAPATMMSLIGFQGELKAAWEGALLLCAEAVHAVPQLGRALGAAGVLPPLYKLSGAADGLNNGITGLDTPLCSVALTLLLCRLAALS